MTKKRNNDMVLFDETEVLNHLKHFLPSQQALKDFVHHNTLHSLQEYDFFTALQMAQETFGYRTLLNFSEFQQLYTQGKIANDAIDRAIAEQKIAHSVKQEMLNADLHTTYKLPKVGRLRTLWKDKLKLDLETIVCHTLFKIVSSYLDQGIAETQFRSASTGLIETIRSIESTSVLHFIHSKQARKLLFDEGATIKDLLDIIVGDPRYYEQYLFDQQFQHPGWSGFVAVAESNPDMLFDKRKISLRDFIFLELLLEIDTLNGKSNGWKKICELTDQPPLQVIEQSKMDKEWQLKKLWQRAFELTYHDQVLAGIAANKGYKAERPIPKFQAFFCIDDREESIRRSIEKIEPECETFGTPAHYSLVIKYRPKGGQFNSHTCPGSAHPKHIITDDEHSENAGSDAHFSKNSYGLLGGWILSQTLGFWSAIKLFINLFKPSVTPGHSSAFEHMSHKADPNYENKNGETFNNLQKGFTPNEMSEIVYGELKRTGLTTQFAPIVYLFGHGGSSTNNPYYAGYNCGACSGKPSSLNARVFAKMVNREDVRKMVSKKGITIPKDTHFIGGLHDTTRDEFAFYDEDTLPASLKALHEQTKLSLEEALDLNAKERARQFLGISTANRPAAEVHKDVKRRSLSLFEPRPELNHSNNCLCIVGRRELTKNLFLDQRAFLSSYDYRLDIDGSALTEILNAASPVCGGINLEYFFSKVDNEKFGAGSKLPHNVVGLFGVANGIEGDLRTGLPTQMIDVHDPLRLMMVIEQRPVLIQQVLDKHPKTKEWYDNEWLIMTVICPDSDKIYHYKKGKFIEYQPFTKQLEQIDDQEVIAETIFTNTPVYTIT